MAGWPGFTERPKRKGNSFAPEAKNPDQLGQIKNVSTHPCEQVFSWGVFLFLFINHLFPIQGPNFGFRIQPTCESWLVPFKLCDLGQVP